MIVSDLSRERAALADRFSGWDFSFGLALSAGSGDNGGLVLLFDNLVSDLQFYLSAKTLYG